MDGQNHVNLLVLKWDLLSANSEPSLAERKALATAVSKQEAAQRLLGQSYCTLVLGLGLEDKHHLGCGRYWSHNEVYPSTSIDNVVVTFGYMLCSSPLGGGDTQ